MNGWFLICKLIDLWLMVDFGNEHKRTLYLCIVVFFLYREREREIEKALPFEFGNFHAAMFDDTTEGTNQPVLISRNHQPVWHLVPRNHEPCNYPPEIVAMGNPRTSHGGLFIAGKISHKWGKIPLPRLFTGWYWQFEWETKHPIFAQARWLCPLVGNHKLGQHFSAKRCVEVGVFLRWYPKSCHSTR